MTQTLKRDPSTGRFIRPTPSEKVAAHVERVNERHPEPTDWSWVPAGTPDGKGGWKYERATGVWSKYPPKPTGDKFYEPPRSQPIEYDKPNWIVSNWWWIALGLILTALIIYLIH